MTRNRLRSEANENHKPSTEIGRKKGTESRQDVMHVWASEAVVFGGAELWHVAYDQPLQVRDVSLSEKTRSRNVNLWDFRDPQCGL